MPGVLQMRRHGQYITDAFIECAQSEAPATIPSPKLSNIGRRWYQDRRPLENYGFESPQCFKARGQCGLEFKPNTGSIEPAAAPIGATEASGDQNYQTVSGTGETLQ